MIKVFGHPGSTCTRKVLMTLAETNTPYDLILVDLAKGEHKADPHFKLQPFGQIPVLDDDGFSLYESRAICRYLSEKAGAKLVPSDLRERARMEQWISVETSNFTPHVMKFIYHHVFKREQTPEVLEAATRGLSLCLGVMDAALAKSECLVDGALSLGDICFMPYIEYAMGSPAKELFAKHPHVMSWWGRVSERPTWRKVAGR